jgi:hypothetical protein
MFKELFEINESKMYTIFVNERYLQQGVDLMNAAYDEGVEYQQWKTSDWIKPVAYTFDAKYTKVFKKLERDFGHWDGGIFQSPDKELQKISYITSMSANHTPKLVTKIA